MRVVLYCLLLIVIVQATSAAGSEERNHLNLRRFLNATTKFIFKTEEKRRINRFRNWISNLKSRFSKQDSGGDDIIDRDAKESLIEKEEDRDIFEESFAKLLESGKPMSEITTEDIADSLQMKAAVPPPAEITSFDLPPVQLLRDNQVMKENKFIHTLESTLIRGAVLSTNGINKSKMDS